MHRLVPGIVIAILLTAATVPAQQPDAPPLQRIIDLPYLIRVVDHCSVPSVVAALARKFNVRAGVEYLPGRCHPSSRPREMNVEVDLLGLTFEDALNRLVAADPRYRWLESESVILLRPVLAWGDRANWLNQPIGSFVIANQDLAGALAGLTCRIPEARCLPDIPTITQTEQAARRFSLELSATSVIGALNRIVRAHGALWWEARDRAGVTQPEDHRMFWLLTPDGSGLGMPTKRYASPQH